MRTIAPITRLALLFSFLSACALGGSEVSGGAAPFARFRELPVTAIRPEGWLEQYLKTQRDGLTGHLEAAGYPFTTVGWNGAEILNNTSIEDWWPYEQNAYWVDGMERCGLLLRDEFLLGKAGAQIDYVLAHPAPNGYLGPLLGGPSSKVARWIHVVFFRALMAAYDKGDRPGIPEALRRHFLANDYTYGGCRDSIAIEAMLWTFGKTGDKALLALAEKTYALAEKANDGTPTSAKQFLEDKPAYEHGVTYDERAKLGAILYLYTGKQEYLEPSVAALRKIDTYHMLIGGVNVSSEFLHAPTTTEAYENCDISDYTWSAGYLLMATGEASYADQIERAVFNAAPGSVSSDFKSLQYFSAPNQVVCTRKSFPRTGGSQMSFAPNPGTECCPGNVNRCMPNFAARLWMGTADAGVAAVMFAPSTLTTSVGRSGTSVTIHEQTGYPFADTIQFTVETSSVVTFPLTLRIPRWCKGAKLTVNGAPLAIECKSGSFVRVEREFKHGDVITLHLPQELELVPGPSHSLSVVRGPLVYSLRIDEDWRKVADEGKSTPDFPAYEVTAKSPWNYALIVKNGRLEGFEEHRQTLQPNPWSTAGAPVEFRVKAKRVPNWVITSKSEVATERWDVERDPKTNKVTRWFIAGEDIQKGTFLYTPEIPDTLGLLPGDDTQLETVRLVPYGCAKLRVTYFPYVSVP